MVLLLETPLTGSRVLDLVALSFLLFLINRLLTWYRLSHVPGPFWNSVSSLALLRTQLGGSVHADLNQLLHKHGSSLVRIGPNAVLTNDAKLVQRMEANRSPYTKSPWYGTFRFMKGTDHSFSQVDERKHADLRTKIGPGYSSTHLAEQSIDRQLLRFLHLIDRKYLSREDGGSYRPLDFARLSHLYSMDVVGDWTFGKPFGFLEEGEDIYDYIRWNEEFFPFVTMASTFPFLATLLQQWPFSEMLPKPSDPVGLGRFMKVAYDAIEERQKYGVDLRNDLMGIFLQHGVGKEDAVNEALVQVVAGTDSVAVAIRMALVYILSKPTVYNKLLTELDEARNSGQVTRPIIRDAEARRLPYLQAVIRESLRIFPTVTPLMYKSVPAGGDLVAGYQLPAGTDVGVDQYGILRSKEYWGEDADLFRPERWLQADEKELEAMSEYLEARFSPLS
ncbi:hypothetical protein JX265_001675 [Neoarthrinium moseri]|uniref:Cytochrome P450 n=1 Tax=Neoarthrinium moseri TaxID=1658444 RepID=A0A9Q0ATI9_9PEZI|nr:hypothetical protein JX265_001675 [Neoarthrinium moseri]